MRTINQYLKYKNACDEAQKWALDKTWEEIWKDCPRGDWLLWLFKRTNPLNIKELFMAKALCANTVRHLMKDKRSTDAIDATIHFANGKITKEELKVFAANASYASAAATDAAASYASDAASYASDASYTSDDASDAAAAAASAANASYASDAADDVSDAASYDAFYAAAYASDAAADARKKNQQETADICRKVFPIEIWNISFDNKDIIIT